MVGQQIPLNLYRINAVCRFMNPQSDKGAKAVGYIVAWSDLLVYVSWESTVTGGLHHPLPYFHTEIELIGLEIISKLLKA